MKELRQYLGEKAIIPVVRREEDLPAALDTGASCLFLVAGDITTIKRDVRLIRERGKACFLYMDFIDGLGADRATVRYLAREVQPTGLVTIKNHLLKHARGEGLLAIQNLFLLDSQAIKTGLNSTRKYAPDGLEILPGIMPRVIREIVDTVSIPVIAGGLLEKPEDIQAAFQAGAAAVAVGRKDLWSIAMPK
ncbi:MAG: glycerol-3-phosphate responsive antiterminator [bacterium]|nr:glycerol-3-phosphate responsive antiterminator [Bacillota bacterium]HHW55390.1 glycerol-3-phosphate responsive antiterminator [Bacillota bacterium]